MLRSNRQVSLRAAKVQATPFMLFNFKEDLFFGLARDITDEKLLSC
jgi:hypothetical protein